MYVRMYRIDENNAYIYIYIYIHKEVLNLTVPSAQLHMYACTLHMIIDIIKLIQAHAFYTKIDVCTYTYLRLHTYKLLNFPV